MTPPEPYQLVEKAMKYNVNDKGFTKSDWNCACMMWPNLHWTESEAEQTFYALLDEGKIREIPDNPGMYELTSSF